jgi:uncharacterized membrane protein YhaH (DUF805 family)
MVSFLFSFRGRINRKHYWLGNTGVTFGIFMLAFIASLILAPFGAKGAPSGILMLVLGLIMFAGGWAGLALQVKRFHDRGRSGWFALAPFLPALMIATTVMGGVATDAPAEAVVPNILPWLGIGMLINLWLFVDLGCLAGTDGPNKFDDNSPPPAPRQSKDGGASVAAMLGAQSAMDRAIEAQGRPTAASPTPPQTPAPNMRPAMASAGPMPAPSGSFGKRAAR